MPYTPNPDDATSPLLSTFAGTAQADFTALKAKINNLFLASTYVVADHMQSIESGVTYVKNWPAGASPNIWYGYACDVTRNDIACAVPVVGGQFNARLGSNINDSGAADVTIFGIATEAWTGDVASQATLKGAENAIIAQHNNNLMQLRGIDIVFKNRSDVRELANLGPVQGLGANKYNANSAGMTFSSNNRSAPYGEYCGWGTGIRFTADCMDIWWDKQPFSGIARWMPAIGIDFTRMPDPVSANPWSAHRISSALALAEYMSITWDKLQSVRSYCDSVAGVHWMTSIGGQAALNGNPLVAPTNGLGYKYTTAQFALNTAVGGVPGAATGSITVFLNGANRFIAVT